MSSVPPRRPPLVTSNTSPLPPPDASGQHGKLVAPSAKDLALRGGLTERALGATGRARPATHQIYSTKSPRKTDREVLRPVTMGLVAPGARQAGKGVQASEDVHAPTDLLGARASWVEAAQTMPLASNVLQPQQALGHLLEGDDNVMAEHLRVFTLPGEQVRWAVSVEDERVTSSAKRRRWAISDDGVLACCLEFIPPHERGLDPEALAYERSRTVRPAEAKARAAQVGAFEQEAVRELQNAVFFNPHLKVHNVVRTQDGRLLAMMTECPEELSFMCRSLPPEHRGTLSIRILAEVAELLHTTLHRKTWLHGDLKPGNIMFTEKGDVTLVDFGLSRRLELDGLMAPEQGDDQPTFAPPEYANGYRMGKAGDMWALGLTLVHMLATADHMDNAMALEGTAQGDALNRTFSQQMQRLMGDLEKGRFEQVRVVLAGSQDMGAVLRTLTSRAPYLRHLQPLCDAAPEVFELVIKSLLAKDPALRKDAVEARKLGKELLRKHAPQLAQGRAAEQAIIDNGTSMSHMAPALRMIAEQQNFTATV